MTELKITVPKELAEKIKIIQKKLLSTFSFNKDKKLFLVKHVNKTKFK